MGKSLKHFVLLGILMILLFLVLPANAQDQVNGMADTPWPMYQHDPQHTGRSPFLGAIQMPELLWTAQLLQCPRFSGGISIAEDGSLLLSIGGCLSSFDPISRQIRWIYNRVGDSSSAALVEMGGNFYWGYGMNFDQISPSGGTNWSAEFGPVLGFNSSPTFGTDGNLYFVKEGIWSFTTAGQYRWFIPYGLFSSASPAIGLDGKIYAGTDIGNEDLCAYLPSGGVAWCLDIPGVAYDRNAAIGSNGIIYMPTEGNPEPPYNDSGVLVAINPSGIVEWKFQPYEGDIFNIPDGIAIDSTGSIIFGLNTYNSDSYLYSIDTNGQFQWKTSFSGNPLTGLGSSIMLPITIDRAGNAFLCLANSRCYCIGPDGTILWEFEFPLFDSIIVDAQTQPIFAADGLFYIVDNKQRLYAYADPSQYPGLKTTIDMIDINVEPGTGSFTITIPITSTIAPISYTASKVYDVDWLFIDQPDGITPAQISIRFEAQALPAGTYHTNLKIAPSDQTGAWLIIPVNLHVGMKQFYLPITLNDFRLHNRILYTSRWFVEHQFASIEPTGNNRLAISRDLPNQIDQMVYSPDGRKAATVPYINGRQQITIIDTQTGQVLLEIGDQSRTLYPAWSPGSNQIAFVSKRDDPENGEVYVINLDGTGLTRLTYNNLNETYMFWSPDGEKIVVQVRGSWIFLMNSDGTEFQQVITGHVQDFLLGWSPDGRYLLLNSQINSDPFYRQLGIFDLQTGLFTFLADNIIAEASWSPDGTHIAYVGHESDDQYDWDIFIVHPDGSGMMNLTHDLSNEDSQPVWSPNSRWIAFSSRNDDIYDDPNYDIYVVRNDGTSLLQVTKNIQEDYYPFWQP